MKPIRRIVAALGTAVLGTALAALSITPASAAPALASDPVPTFDYSNCPKLPSGADRSDWSCFVAVVTSGEFKVGKFDQQLTSPITITFAQGFDADGNTSTIFGKLQASKMLVRPGIFGDPILTAVYAKPVYVGGFAIDNYNIDMKLKINLTNPFLGGTCTIGSDSSPIDLHLITGTTNPPPPNGPISGSAPQVVSLDPYVLKLTNVDNSFAVGHATGCLLNFGLVNAIVDSQAGVPAAAGQNTMIYNEYASYKSYLNLP
ncbi:hypothetical protein [Actinomadura verrucosospora]|uniref:Secreted protein n=1 Tax=Actinomadura verrucosospora TaxID=46165 RepID=A0A7D3ZT35_ACTVE|nr:hypothetical protein [Actinomadura verrucosospora]QKG27083.1 secreted protein [Actinomadura verrucosospora]